MEQQIIGIDLGRGYVKSYTEFKDNKNECMFKSIVGQGRDMEFKNYEEPIYLEVNNEDYFVGILAEKEADNPTRNSKDDKTTLTAKKLLYAVLSKLAVAEEVKIMLGVPNKNFRKSVLNEVKECYEGKTIIIKDKITGNKKEIKIVEIAIFRESDSALLYTIAQHKEKTLLEKSVCGMITVGFRTTEISYFDKGMKFVDKFSKSSEKGNSTALDYVRKKILADSNIVKELHEIDSCSDYDNLKAIAYENLCENIEQELEGIWTNQPEMKIFIAGGTALKLKSINKNFELVKDAQTVTAKGLFLVAKNIFKSEGSIIGEKDS